LYVERQRIEESSNSNTNINTNNTNDNDIKPIIRDITNDEPIARKNIPIEVYVAIILAIISYFLLK